MRPVSPPSDRTKVGKRDVCAEAPGVSQQILTVDLIRGAIATRGRLVISIQRLKFADRSGRLFLVVRHFKYKAQYYRVFEINCLSWFYVDRLWVIEAARGQSTNLPPRCFKWVNMR